MDRTKEELAYSRQKNREHIWNQVKGEYLEKYGTYDWLNMECEQWFDKRYESLCINSGITPWVF